MSHRPRCKVSKSYKTEKARPDNGSFSTKAKVACNIQTIHQVTVNAAIHSIRMNALLRKTNKGKSVHLAKIKRKAMCRSEKGEAFLNNNQFLIN